MSNGKGKEFLGDMLKKLGVSDETVTAFKSAYDNDMNEAVEAKKEETITQFREEQSRKLPTIQEMAAKANVRNR